MADLTLLDAPLHPLSGGLFARSAPRLPGRDAIDASFLAPPVNTFKSPHRRRRHRPTRSHSAPPAPDRRRPPDSPPPLSFTTRGGELLPPPPPLCTFFFFFSFSHHLIFVVRPTTFWRKTRRSGVTGASYSPSSHLIRRSTYIAAGLQFDSPIHDLSALCVESRVGCIVIQPEFAFAL